jgi:hypothetical protein
MPPYFTLAGLKIYTPNWLIYKFFPIFRVTARLGIVVYFVLLSLMAKVVFYIKENQLFSRKILKFFIFLLLIVTLTETYIPIKMYRQKQPPEVFKYLEELGGYHRIAVFPYSKADDTYLWMPVHKQLLVNPRGYRNSKYGYSSEELTKSITTKEGLEKLKKLEVEYLIVFKEGQYLEYFDHANSLEVVEKFDDSVIYKLN